MPKLTKNQEIQLNKNREVIELIKEAVCVYFGISINDLTERKLGRKAKIIKTRQFIIYISSCLAAKASRELVGQCLGGLDHSTVTHHLKVANGYLETDKLFKTQIEQVMSILTGEGELTEEFQKYVAARYFHVDLNNIKVVKISSSSSMIFTGVSDEVISKIKSDYFIGEGNKTLELTNTGLNILAKKNTLMKS